MGMLAETTIIDYCLLFADQRKQTSVFRFRLQQTNESLPFFRFCIYIYIETLNICCYFKWKTEVFPTRLLTSEDECKWFWHQMIYFPGTINIVNTQLHCRTYITMNLFFILQLCTLTLTLCMLAILSRDGVVFFLPHPLPHLWLWVTSSLLLCL